MPRSLEAESGARGPGVEPCRGARWPRVEPGGRGWSPGAEGGAVSRSPVTEGGARGRGWSHDAEPWGRGPGWSQQPGLGQEHSSTFQQGLRRRRRFLGTRVRSAFITYSRETALVLQGPGDVGTRRVSVAQVGAERRAFRGGSGSIRGMPDWPQTARLQGSHFQGRSGPLGGFNPISCRVADPSFPSVTSQIPDITTSPKSTLFWPGVPARSREEPPRTKWAREGKEVGAAAPPCKKFRETPGTPPPSPLPLITH